jgi:Reverse transcriptase (RNA-dependent DNA polymerase)
MSGKKYGYVKTVLEPTVHPDAHIWNDNSAEISQQVVAAIFTQLSMKAGIKQWGEPARDACKAEIYQLHMRETFEPLEWENLTTEQKKTTLESHLFLKLKSDGKIKGRAVAGGNRQRGFIAKEDATSPTVATESVLLTAVIEALENRDVAVVDIPNAFIQTRIENKDEMAIIRFRGELVDMLVEIAPEVYKPYVSINHRGEKTIILRCQNAIYGTMVASLHYYKKFTKSLLDEGFTLNPYDPCVANKTVEGNQITICFHVDDCKIAHRNSKIVDETIEWLRVKYESIFEDGSGKMKVSRGKIHEYLGMTLDYTTTGIVRVTMFKYIDEIIETYSKFDNIKLKSTAAPEDLLRI